MSLPASLLNKTATLRRFTQTGTDRRNHPTGDYADHSTFPVALQPASGREVYDGQNVVVVQFRAYANAGVGVRSSDRLVIDGKTYHVIFAADASSRGHHVEIDLQLLDEDAR